MGWNRRFATLLADILEHQRAARVVVARDRSRARVAGAGPAGVPRLMLSLEGVRNHRYTYDGEVREVSLDAGDALVIGPGALLSTFYRRPNRALSAVFEAHSVRLVLVTADPAPGEELLAGQPVAQEVIPGALDRQGRAILQALLADAGDTTASVRHRLFQALLDKLRLLLETPPAGVGGARLTWLRVCGYVDEHFMQPINRAETAAALGLHPNHLSRLFRRFGEQTFTGYLNERRLQHSAHLLLDSRRTVADIAAACGFQSATHFNRTFKARFGTTPSTWRGTAEAGRTS